MHNTANVYLWGTHIGTVLLNDGNPIAKFQYTDAFREMGIEVSPINMPLKAMVFEFPELSIKCTSPKSKTTFLIIAQNTPKQYALLVL